MEAKVKAQQISIHALREEGDLSPVTGSKRVRNFYPRPPRGGRRCGLYRAQVNSEISIHALREEGDPGCKMAAASSWAFLSTPSARRATMKWDGSNNDYKFLSTPSARRATSSRDFLYSSMSISIHALREEGDHSTHTLVFVHKNFYPRPPRGGRPATTSPHGSRSYFYPRPPRGGRPFLIASRMRSSVFLSTPSARRATAPLILIGGNIMISIHALREEGDHWPTSRSRPSMNFYPRPPRGGRHSFAICLSSFAYFYPRPPRGGRRVSNTYIVMTERFLSTPSARRATAAGSTGTSASTNFYPRPPRGGRLSRGIKEMLLDTISIHALREEGDTGADLRLLGGG